MFDPKRYIYAGGTVIVALGIGIAMQQSDALTGSRKSAPKPSGSEIAALDLADISFTAAMPALPVIDTGIVAPEPTVLAALTPDTTPQTLPEVDACDVVLTGTALPGARVMVDLTAPCHGAQSVTLHHNGMMISVQTDADGAASTVLPALSAVAVIVAAFADGTGGIVTAEIPDIAEFDRVVLQWRGLAGFELHALENGADYGTSGHVSAGTPHSPERALSGTGGYMEVAGGTAADGLHAQVYTFPRRVAAPSEVVLNAELAVTKANCTRLVEAQSIQTSGGSALRVQELSLTIPSCDMIGDILLLKNLLEDLKIVDN